MRNRNTFADKVGKWENFESSEEILKARFVRGEIDEKEFEFKMSVLRRISNIK
jgi:uncharacterized membrane protein